MAKAEEKAKKEEEARIMAETDRDVDRYHHTKFKEDTCYWRKKFPKLKEDYMSAVAVIQMVNQIHGTDYDIPMDSFEHVPTRSRGTSMHVQRLDRVKNHPEFKQAVAAMNAAEKEVIRIRQQSKDLKDFYDTSDQWRSDVMRIALAKD